jgi:phosphoglycerate kinase
MSLAEDLANLADIYVNDAFPVSHREHASIVSLPKKLPGYIGFQFKKEIDNLSKAFNPEHPFLFILGGAKFETKINLVRKFLDLADKVFLGGALVNSVFKRMGYEVGVSLVDDGMLNLDFVLNNPKIILPRDVSVRGPVGDGVKLPTEVRKDKNILDIGDETLGDLVAEVGRAKYILWNGPLGNYEKGFDMMTKKTAEAIANSGATTIVGGGDTLAVIESLGIMDKFTFVSSGGGAMLDFLANGTLPGLEALELKQ